MKEITDLEQATLELVRVAESYIKEFYYKTTPKVGVEDLRIALDNYKREANIQQIKIINYKKGIEKPEIGQV